MDTISPISDAVATHSPSPPYVVLAPFPLFAPHHSQHCPNTSPNKQKYNNDSSEQHETKRQKSDLGSTPIRSSSGGSSGGRGEDGEEKGEGREGREGRARSEVDGLFVPFVSGSGRPMLRIRGTCIEVDGEHVDDGDVGPEISHISMAVEDEDQEEEEGEEDEEDEEEDGEEAEGEEEADGEEGQEVEQAGEEGAREHDQEGHGEGEEGKEGRDDGEQMDEDEEEEEDEDYEPGDQDDAELDDDVSSLRELVERGIFTVVDDHGQEYYVVAEDAKDDDEDEEEAESGAEGEGQPVSSDDEEALLAVEPGRRLRGFRRRLPSPSAPADTDDKVDKEHLQPFLRQTHHHSLYTDKYPVNTFSHIRQSCFSASSVSSASASRSASLVHSAFVPASPATHSLTFPAPVFCGRFSHTGEMYSCASQDGYIHLYTTDPLCRFKSIEARDVDWAIIDVDFSHNQRFVVYSGWSNCLQLVNVPSVRNSGEPADEYELHEALNLRPGFGRSCMFSVRFNPTDTELLAGLNRGVLIVYDIERRVNVLKASAHGDDINTVCYLDAGDSGGAGNIMVTGSDDHLIKVWDRRTQSCIGGWIAHTDGLTSVVSCCDGQYVLSNSKDQTMKLHDMRRMNKCSELAHYTPTHQPLDYRYRRRRHQTRSRMAGDQSLVTYSGHTVMQTLIRCGVSPSTVNRRYAYTGSSDGDIYVFDCASGETVAVLPGHSAIVREVHWSPRGDSLMSASWDETVKRWQYNEKNQPEEGVKD